MVAYKRGLLIFAQYHLGSGAQLACSGPFAYYPQGPRFLGCGRFYPVTIVLV